jgi:flagellar hook-associated protein 1 FlgK
MGLSASLTNALSGMATSQNSLQVLSRNVANAGTPGYHKQSLNVIDNNGLNSTYAVSGGVDRAFNQSLQVYYTSATADAGYTDVRASTLDRLQTYFGKPGDTASLDTMFGTFQNALQALTTSPDNYATRANVVAQAQALASTLNTLSTNVQGLRQETEAQMANSVDALNNAISSLQQVNSRLAVQNQDQGSRAALMDQRDRLVSQVAEYIDVKVDYRSDGTVGLMTNTGVGILDVKASVFSFQPAGTMTAEKQYNADSNKSGVGKLTLTTSSGLTIDLVQQRVLQSGKLAGLVELRDTTLVAAQSQLDEIAAGLAKAFSTVTTTGQPVSAGAQNGYSLDVGNLIDGNDFTLTYSVGGIEKNLRVVNVGDASKLPLDYLDANGARVVGMDFSGGAAAVATGLASKLGPGFTVTGSGGVLTVLNDGSGGNTSIGALVGHATASGLQNGDTALSLFVDRSGADFTDSLGGKGQKLGFASRITVNSAVLNDTTLLVQYQAGGSLGDAARANTLLDQLRGMSFGTAMTNLSDPGSFRLGGSVSDLISQTMNYVGNAAARAISADDTQQLTMDALTQRMDTEYGVNVDEEMARLMELQNSYAANSRIISVVQDLMNKLMQL